MMMMIAMIVIKNSGSGRLDGLCTRGIPKSIVLIAEFVLLSSHKCVFLRRHAIFRA
jgi:hypothetical protein